ncbi:MAG: CCA tRNA nucleotidyltransferase [Sedimentitalea sp.]
MTQITAPWLTDATSQKVCRALTCDGNDVLFVGGCVRNALLGASVSDLDLATNARPEITMKLAQSAGLAAIPTGIAHGTITVVADNRPFEVTTFRKDVSTDGRRAVVAFSDDICEDAQRRDFTMNALYARPDGNVIDPLNGLTDLFARRVRFIGQAEQRIREDYLRSLRYFRFHAWYGDTEAGFDPEALASIAQELEGIATLSRERVGAELCKLLAAPDPAPAIATMQHCGLLHQILPGSDSAALTRLIHIETQAHQPARPMVRLAALGGLVDTLRLGKSTMRDLETTRKAALSVQGAPELGHRLGASMALDALALRSALMEAPWDSAWATQVSTGASAVFPVTGVDLMPAFSGAALGAQLKWLKSQWIASGFRLTKSALLELSKSGPAGG